jgi:hypothetical protein
MERVRIRDRKEEANLSHDYQKELLHAHNIMFDREYLVDSNNTMIPILILDDSNVTEDIIESITTILSNKRV